MNYYSAFKLALIILLLTLTSCVISSYNDPCSLSGKVTDSAGKGISNVIIIAESALIKDTIKTSSDGSYIINFLNGGAVDLVFSKTGYTGISSNLVLLGGEKKVLDIKLNALSEDAYFNVGLKEKTILNTGETFSAGISTNVSYEYESMGAWITCTKTGSELYIKCDSNETSEERITTVILRAEYNLKDTIKIKQLAGPVLRILDYLGKNNTSFPQTRPFVTFSREISVLSATGSNENLSVELSEDKRTVYFSNIKLNAFSSMPIQLKVVASDGIQLTCNLDVKLYVNSQFIPPNNGQKFFFTNDNRYVWVYTINGFSSSLRQFSCIDFKEQTPIILTESSNQFYNSYNNSLYVVTYRYFEDRYVSDVSIYNAETSAFTSRFTIDSNGNTISAMAFSDSGYGLMILGDKLFYIDSSDSHKWGIFSSSTILYDPHQYGWLLPRYIEMCNSNKTFVLYGEDTSGTISVYTVSAETKVLARIFNSTGYHLVTTSNSGAIALYYYDILNSIICQNVLTKTSKTLTLPSTGTRNTALLLAEDSTPYILTSDFSVITVNDNTIQKFTHQGECYYIKSSNDGKLVLVNNNGTVYLFQSEMFTKFNNYIKSLVSTKKN